MNLIFQILEFIPSSGIGCIINLHKAIAAANGQLALTGVQPKVQDILDKVNLTQLFDVVGDNSGSDMQAINEINESILVEYNLLATLNKITSQILSTNDETNIPTLMLRHISHHLNSPISLYLENEDSESDKWIVKSLSGSRYEILCHLENELDSDHTFECKFPDLPKPYIFKDEVPRDRWPEFLKVILKDEQTLIVPIKINGQKTILLMLALAEHDEIEKNSLIYIMKNYSGICALALENRQLLNAYQLKTEQLDKTLRRLESTHQSLIEAGKLANYRGDHFQSGAPFQQPPGADFGLLANFANQASAAGR